MCNMKLRLHSKLPFKKSRISQCFNPSIKTTGNLDHEELHKLVGNAHVTKCKAKSERVSPSVRLIGLV